MRADLRLDPDGLDHAAARTAALAADLAALTRRAQDGAAVLPAALIDALEAARRTVAETAETLRRTASTARGIDRDLSRTFHDRSR